MQSKQRRTSHRLTQNNRIPPPLWNPPLTGSAFSAVASLGCLMESTEKGVLHTLLVYPLCTEALSNVLVFCFPCVFLKISSALALRPLCAHGSGLGPKSGTGSGEGGWVCVGVCACVCPCCRPSQRRGPTDRANPSRSPPPAPPRRGAPVRTSPRGGRAQGALLPLPPRSMAALRLWVVVVCVCQVAVGGE
jgi:hypothetical protein